MADLFQIDPESSAILSPCGVYRYRLDRSWDKTGKKVAFIMLNPSTANAELDDPTIRRCKAFARAWGFGGITIGNLFALRSTEPEALKAHPDPVGPDNDRHLGEIVSESSDVVCAWGAHGTLAGRSTAVSKILASATYLKMLRLTASGEPGHPLYLPSMLTPQLWNNGEGHA